MRKTCKQRDLWNGGSVCWRQQHGGGGTEIGERQQQLPRQVDQRREGQVLERAQRLGQLCGGR